MPNHVPIQIQSIIRRLETEGATLEIRSAATRFFRGPDGNAMTTVVDLLQAEDSITSKKHYAELGSAIIIASVMR